MKAQMLDKRLKEESAALLRRDTVLMTSALLPR